MTSSLRLHRALFAVALVAGAGGSAAAKTEDPPLASLPGVDLKGLDEGQARWLRELLDEYPSPCGKSHSLYTSLRTDPACKRAAFASHYLCTLLRAGLMKSECEEQYEKRFVKPDTGKCETTGMVARGNPSARVTVCEFADFECPHCRAMEPIFQRLLGDLKDKVKLYYKNYPIEKLHPDARDAAAAAVAAGKQGKFWEMHDKLFANQDKLSASDLEGYAAELKLDVKKWKADLASARAQVEKEHAEGEKLDVTATPTIYINGRKYAGPHQYDDIKDWIDEELAK